MDRQCEKCGTFFKPEDKYKNDNGSIYVILCNHCRKRWLLFYRENERELRFKFPRINNPAWDIFIGVLSNKEKVVFT